MSIFNKKNRLIVSLVALVVVLTGIIIALILGGGNYEPSDDSSATKVGFVTSETKNKWEASYERLDGRLEKTFKPDGDKTTLILEFSTDEGELDYYVFDENGEAREDEDEYNEIVGNGSWTVEIDGEVTVRLEARNHKGSYSIRLE